MALASAGNAKSASQTRAAAQRIADGFDPNYSNWLARNRVVQIINGKRTLISPLLLMYRTPPVISLDSHRSTHRTAQNAAIPLYRHSKAWVIRFT